MKKRVLIIDDSANLLAKISRLLNLDRDDVEVTQYNTKKSGWQPDAIDFASYDLFITDFNVDEQDILSWLEDSVEYDEFPATILLCSGPDDNFVDSVIDAGFIACLDKLGLTRSLLNQSVAAGLDGTMSLLNAGKSEEGKEPGSSQDTTDSDTQADKDTEVKEAIVDFPELDQSSHSELSMSFDNLTRPSLDNYTPPDEASRKVRKPRPRGMHQARKRFSTKKSTVPEIPGYKVMDKIGQGGMSVIYLAERESDNKKVVIKVLSSNLAENDTQVIRSNQEYKLISRIKSPHIVKLYDHGIVDNATYTVMEYFSSGDMKQRMSKGITQVEGLQFLNQICSGLAAIHGCGVIHRDLKPANIMFRDDDTLAILDFGISRDINSQLDLTRPGQIIGTPNYMAPEQGNSGYKPDARSDIYAVGVMLYEMLTGKKPYRAANAASIIYMHAHEPIPKLPNQFFEMQGIIDNCMAKFPHQRFQSAIDMIDYIKTEFRWDITLGFK